MRDRARQTVQQFHMLSRGDQVLIGLSGGADSVALLLFLLELSKEFSLSLSCVHINHLLRGEESERDEGFCKNLCKTLEIPLFLHRIPVETLAKEQKKSIELCAREQRYAVFEELAKQHGFHKIAVAHNQNDNGETLLFHLARGTGLCGLQGIPPLRDGIIRPLLFSSRESIEAFLKEKNQSFCQDSTNQDIKYMRNHIRHNIYPQFLAINPSMGQTLEKTMLSLKEDEEYLLSQVKPLLACFFQNNCFSMPQQEYSALPRALSKRILACVFKEIGEQPLSFSHMEQIDSLFRNGNPEKYKNLFGLHCGYKEQNVLIKPMALFCPTKEDYCFSLLGEKGEFAIPHTNFFISYEIFEKNCPPAPKVHKKLQNCLFNYDKIYDKVIVRPRAIGDAYAPLGYAHKRSVKKMMNEAKIPKEQRDFLPVFCCGSKILWVPGLRPNHFFSPTDHTKKILQIQIREDY